FNVPTCNYGKAVALFDTVPFDPGPLIHPLNCSSVFPNNMIGCVVASSFKLPYDDGFSDHESSKYFRAGFFSVDQHMFVEIPHRTFIDFVKTLDNFTEAMVFILAAIIKRDLIVIVNGDLTVIVNGVYFSDTSVEVFYNFNTQLQIIELQDHGRVFTIVSVDDKSISYFNFRASILANKFLEGGK
ncbi:ATP synthase gamma chain chloroplastic-like, partial [Trifolium medium]|nr:ATP synthase gamma chain chloroplastic-like [Trifolium medium]